MYTFKHFIILEIVTRFSNSWPVQCQHIFPKSVMEISCTELLSHVQRFVTLWTAALQALGILQARVLEWVVMPSSRGSSWPRDRTRGSMGSHRVGHDWSDLAAAAVASVPFHFLTLENNHHPLFFFLTKGKNMFYIIRWLMTLVLYYII